MCGRNVTVGSNPTLSAISEFGHAWTTTVKGAPAVTVSELCGWGAESERLPTLDTLDTLDTFGQGFPVLRDDRRDDFTEGTFPSASRNGSMAANC